MRTIQLFRNVSVLLLSAVALVSCNNETLKDDPNGEISSGGDIRFSIGIAPQTRVTTGTDFDSKFETGDEIGVFAVKHGDFLSESPSKNVINNVKLVYDATNETWTPSTPLYWPSSGSGIPLLDFYAYYPYDANAANPTTIAFNVKTDQSATTKVGEAEKSNYNLSELMAAKSDNSGNGCSKGSTVQLTFSHSFSMIQVTVPFLYKGVGPSENLRVTLQGVKSKAVLNLANVTVTAGSGIKVPDVDNGAMNIAMYRVEKKGDVNYKTSYTYRALVPAQTVEENNVLFKFGNERQLLLDNPLTSTFQMQAGQAEKFTRNLPLTLLNTVLVPSGNFLMGQSEYENPPINDEVQHLVTLNQNFYMTKYEITNVQYAEYLNTKGIKGEAYNGNIVGKDGTDILIYATNDASGRGLKWEANKWAPQTNFGDHPVINVTWYGASKYAAWVGGLLPTEAQWECASRGGSIYYWSGTSDESQLGDYAWFAGNNGTDNGTKMVGLNKPNDLGLYDMSGNVYEWCSDWYQADYEKLPLLNPTGPEHGNDATDGKVFRGGSYKDQAKLCRCATRFKEKKDFYTVGLGFRVVFAN